MSHHRHPDDEIPADRDVEVSHDLASFVAELRKLADALETGAAFTIEVEGEMVAVPPHAEMSVVHEREDGDVELEFRLTWSEVHDDTEEDEDGDTPDDEDADADEDGDDDAAPKVAAA